MDSKAVALALSMRNTPGAWAVLLGEGIARAAGVPAIQDVGQHICRQLAAARTGGPVSDPHSWFNSTFGREATWDAVLAEVAPDTENRERLLQPYFAPTDEAHELGPSEPGRTHRAVANLVRRGFVRVVITTGIDDLVESALRDAGIDFAVVQPGQQPASRHGACSVLKLNGSWRDLDALAADGGQPSYAPDLQARLDDVLANCALIAVGWSGKSDAALREALRRRRNHRQMWYWLQSGEQFSDEALEVIVRAEATPITIPTPDEFLGWLVARMDTPPRAPGPVVGDTLDKVRQYLADDSFDTELESLLVQSVNAVYKRADSPMAQASGDPSKFSQLLDGWLEHTRLLRGILAVMAVEGQTDRHRQLVCATIERLCLDGVRQMPTVLAMPLLPTLLVLYTAGIAAVAAERYDNLRAVLVDPELNRPYQDPIPVIGQVNVETFSYDRRFLPVANSRSVDAWSTWLHRAMEPSLREFVSMGFDYDSAFARFEFLFGLTAIDRVGIAGILNNGWGGKREGAICGQFAWNDPEMKLVLHFLQAGAGASDRWGVLTHLFDGDRARLHRALLEYGRFIRAVTAGDSQGDLAGAYAGVTA